MEEGPRVRRRGERRRGAREDRKRVAVDRGRERGRGGREGEKRMRKRERKSRIGTEA